ncbi:MAG: hypothetical protein HY323_08210 [Betaproteobacteria bacterium]|nr:hypothetical protein [Betaproteobacteria bacterium]
MKKPRRKPHHVTLSQVVKGQQSALLAALNRGRSESSSVELTRNAKGDTQIKVSVSSREGESIEATSMRAQDTYDALAQKYAAPKS